MAQMATMEAQRVAELIKKKKQDELTLKAGMPIEEGGVRTEPATPRPSGVMGLVDGSKPPSKPPMPVVGAPANGKTAAPGLVPTLSSTPLLDVQNQHAQTVAAMKPDPLLAIRPHSNDQAVQKQIEDNLMREQLRQAGIAKRSALASPVPQAGSPEYDARIAAITGAQKQEGTLQRAMSTPQAVQSPEAILAAHNDLGAQGKKVAESMLQQAIAAKDAALKSGDPARLAASQKGIDDAVAAGAGLDQKFGPGSLDMAGATARNIQQSQFAEKQRVAKEEALANVNSDWERQAPIVAAGRDAQLKGAQIPAAALNAKLAAYDASANQSLINGGSPAVAKAAVGEAEARAKLGEQQAKNQLDAATGGKPTTQSAAIAQQQRADTDAQFQIDANSEARKNRAIQSMRSEGSWSNSGYIAGGNAVGGDNESHLKNITAIEPDIANLEEMAKVNPERAAQLAGMLLNEMPEPPDADGYRYTLGSPFGNTTRKMIAGRMTGIYRRLKALTGQ